MDKVRERGDRLFKRCILVKPVRLIEVDIARSQAAQGRVAARDDPLSRESPVLWGGAHGESDLGADDNRLPADPGNGRSEQLLGPSIRVHVSSVKDCDAS